MGPFPLEQAAAAHAAIEARRVRQDPPDPMKVKVTGDGRHQGVCGPA